MALFRIYKGNDSARLTDPSNPNYLPKVDGYCYFDTSTGLFYIDARTGGTDQNPIITRAPLNALKATQDIDGSRIDTTYLKKSIGTTKGDIIYWSGNGTPVRLGAGSNGQVLKIANGIPTWATDNNTNTAHTTFTWTNGTIAGPTGSLSGNHTAVSFGAIPSASSSTSGIITTTTQNIAGIKTFDNDIIIKGGLNNYFACTGTAATTKKVNNVTNYVPALWKCDSTVTVQDGAMITVKIPTAGHDYGVWLSVDNGTTYKPIAQTMQGTGRLTTHFPVNSLLTLVYDSNHRSDGMFPVAGGTARSNITGSWVILNGYNTDSIETYTEYAGETTGSIGLMANAILLRTAANRWDSVVTSSKIATDKARNTTGFIIGSKIWWTNYTVASNTALHSSWRSIYSFRRRIDFRYSSNCGTTLTPGKPVYLVGTVTNGYFYLDATWWTQTIPTAEDGKVYVLVGGAYSNYQVDLYENNEWYWFKNNAFTLYSTNVDTAVNADKLDGKHLNEIAAGKTTTLSWNTESTIATIGGNAIKVKLPANPNTDTGATSVEVTGTGNAITAASYNASTRKLTLTKGATYNNYSLPIATASALGGVKSSTTGKTANRDYAVEVKTDGTMKVNVPWTDHTYSLAGLVGSTAIGKANLPIYWNGSKFTTITSYEGNAATASKVNNKLTIGGKEYDGSKAVSVSLTDLGLSRAMKFIGTTTAIANDSTETPIIESGQTNYTNKTAGDVVLNTTNNYEYLWTGSAWQVLGPGGSYDVAGTAAGLINALDVSEPTANGSGLTFIATASQTDGKISVTKKTVQDASTSQKGVLQFTAANTNAQLNQLTTGTSTPQDNDYFISQYAGGGTTTTTYHRRPVSALATYMKGKLIDVLDAASVGGAGKYISAISETDGKINATATNTSVSNAWTAGSTNGPTLSTTVNGVTGTAVAIPSASSSTSGVVTTSTQSFAGLKTFTGGLFVNTAAGTNPLTIARNGSIGEYTKFYQDDQSLYIDMTNDETTCSTQFKYKATDTENSDGSNAHTATITMGMNASGTTYVTAGTFNGNAITASKVNHTLTIGKQKYDGSGDISIPVYTGVYS